MATLYEGELAEIYDAMYQSFVNYDEEYLFYSKMVQENMVKSILEIGCGTGNLAKRFYNENYSYTGLDYSKDMLTIANKRNPDITFLQGDMRNFNLKKEVDAILITGRTTSYWITNKDINNTLKSIYHNLSKNGIFCFDFIDANRYIPYIIENELIIHESQFNGVNYRREANWVVAPSENMMLNWTANYFITDKGNNKSVIKDFSTVRVFTLNEIQLFLYLNGFEIIKTIDRKTYAYDTFVIVAKKRI